MNKAFIFCLFIASLFLVCINGYVFRQYLELGIIKVEFTLEPLNIECSNGKVIVD